MAIASGSVSELDDGGSETAAGGELEAEGDADTDALESAEAASTSSVGPADGDGSIVGESDCAGVWTGALGTALKVASMTDLARASA